MNEFLERLAERWKLSHMEMATLIRFDGRNAEGRVADLFRIYETVSGLFRDADAERKWIRQPIDSFNGRSCLDVMLGRSAEDLVNVRRVVEHITGR